MDDPMQSLADIQTVAHSLQKLCIINGGNYRLIYHFALSVFFLCWYLASLATLYEGVYVMNYNSLQ